MPLILSRPGDLPARLLLWAALCAPTLVVARQLAYADRTWPAWLWSASAACAVAALPWPAFVAARWIAVGALPAIWWWTGFAALNGVGPGWEAAVAAVSSSPREVIEAASLAGNSTGFIACATASTLLLLASVGWRWRSAGARTDASPARRQAVLAAALLPFCYSGIATVTALGLPGLFLPTDIEFSPLGTAMRLAQDGIDRSLDDRPIAPRMQRRAASTQRQVTLPRLAIFVIGESLRANSFGPQQAGRGPWSKQLADRIEAGLGAWLPVTCAGANGTHLAVPMLLTATPPARAADASTAPSVLAVLKAAGYATAWLDNQDTLSFSESGHDYYWKIGSLAALKGGFDEALIAPAAAFAAPLLDRDAAANARPRALVAHTMGSHFDYRLRYPAGWFGAEPDTLSSDALVAWRYARSVEYTALVLTRWAELLDRARVPAFLVFTGDHGENLPTDGNGLSAHLGPRASLRDGTTSSLVLWNRLVAEEARTDQVLRLLKAAALISHVDVARAFLALAGIANEAVKPEPEPKIIAPVVIGEPYTKLNRCTDLAP